MSCDVASIPLFAALKVKSIVLKLGYGCPVLEGTVPEFELAYTTGLLSADIVPELITHPS